MTPDGTTRRRHPLLGPWWIIGHVVALTILVVFPQLSAWQFRRMAEEQAIGQAQQDRLDLEPVPLADALTLSVPDGNREYLPVTVTGHWLADQQVAQRNRSLDGQGGFDLLTPLATSEGSLSGRGVLVRRGWVPPDGPASATPTTDVPVADEVTVTGWLEAPVSQPGFGPQDADQGVLDTVFHADIERLQAQVDVELAPMLVHLTAQAPTDGDLPIPQPAPEVDSSTNLSYALQWAAFTVIFVGGYVFVLWRRLHDRRAGVDSDIDPLLQDGDDRQRSDTAEVAP